MCRPYKRGKSFSNLTHVCYDPALSSSALNDLYAGSLFFRIKPWQN